MVKSGRAPSGQATHEPSQSPLSRPDGECPSREALLSLADGLERSFTTNTKGGGAGDAFATMCWMSDGLKALGGEGGLVGNKLGPREIATALRARAEQVPA